MTTFQLDQCLDSKRFAHDCAAEGLCGTLRLPPSLRNAADPDLLTALMTGSHPLVTFDRALPKEHTSFISESHPGILIISNYPAPQTMTIRIAQRVLSLVSRSQFRHGTKRTGRTRSSNSRRSALRFGTSPPNSLSETVTARLSCRTGHRCCSRCYHRTPNASRNKNSAFVDGLVRSGRHAGGPETHRANRPVGCG